MALAIINTVRMVQSVAINIGANTNEPGFRGPIFADGTFEYVPIPETAPVKAGVNIPTYNDLTLSIDVTEVASRPVHLDPTFLGVHGSIAYTYGDPFGVKAQPILALSRGDILFFYATLTTHGRPKYDWITDDWGAYIIGAFRVGSDPLSGEEFQSLPRWKKERYLTNAHLKRQSFDAAVMVYGNPDTSFQLSKAIPLSSSDTGTKPNSIVTALSTDSGKGPWWRRPLKFGHTATATLFEMCVTGDRSGL